MKKLFHVAAGLTVLLAAIEVFSSSAALARGGASNIMNSPGYQRRLQESRGYVSNQSGSILPDRPPVHRERKVPRR